MASTASATTFTVNTTKDSTDSPSCGTSETCSLRDAITKAISGSGDTINFKSTLAGTITLTSALPEIQASMTIEYTGPYVLVISGAGKYQIFNVNAAPVTISGLTLVNSTDANSTEQGGAIHDTYGSLTITDCTFVGNTSTQNTGAIFDNTGTLKVANSTFSDNSSGSGNGGAIDDEGGTLDVAGSTFSRNSNNYGGAIFASGSHLNATNNTFFDNTGYLNGGALSLGGTVTTTVIDNTFVGNRSNTTSGAGGAIYSGGGGPLTIENNIFFDNSASSKNGGAVKVAAGTPTEEYNLFFNNPGGAGFTTFGTGDVTGSNADPNLLPLGYYGGTTETMMPRVGSPAICKGLAADVPGSANGKDQRGFPIAPTNGACSSSANVDIGAVQTNYLIVTSTAGGSVTGSLRAELADGDVETGDDVSFSLGAAPATITVSTPLSLSQGHTVIIGSPAGVTISGGGSTDILKASGTGTALALYGLTFAQGRINGQGGAIEDQTNAVLTVTGCTFTGNSATGTYGGGAAIDHAGRSLTVTDSTFYDNSATYLGGAILGNGKSLTITNSTFADNSAIGPNGEGGAVYVGEGWLNFFDNIFFNNSAVAVDYSTTSSTPPVLVTEGANLFYDNTGGNAFGFVPSFSTTGPDYNGNPKLLPLGHFGGPTETMMPGVGSAAIGVGAPAVLPFGAADQRGFPFTSAVDIGAVQTNYLVVSETTDADDGPSQSCDAKGDSPCSLRDAVNTVGGPNPYKYADIGFSTTLAGGSPTITLPGTYGALTLYQGHTVIVGSPDTVTISGNSYYDTFDIYPGSSSTPAPVVTLYGLTLTNGTFGGAISTYPGPTVLTVDNCTFSGNTSTGGTIFSDSSILNVFNSTFSGNNATGGGAILTSLQSNTNIPPGTTTIVNSTFYNNSGAFGGGAILNENGGTLLVTSSTFASNISNANGGAIDLKNGTLDASNNIFSGNQAAGSGGGIYNNGGTVNETYNLFYGNTGVGGVSGGTGDVTGDPMLASLAGNGGVTQTMLPLLGSAAICGDTATRPYPFALPTTDQRGFPRPNATYNGFSASTPCIDFGAVQTNYQSIQFIDVPTANPNYSENSGKTFSPVPVVSVTENGQSIGNAPVTLTLTGSPAPTSVTGDGTDTPVYTAVDGSGAAFSNLTVTVNSTTTFTLSSALQITSGVSISTTQAPTLKVTETKKSQTITFPAITSPQVVGETLPLDATASSGLTVTYESDTTSVCTVSGSTTELIGAGTCTIDAKQIGDSTYLAASTVERSFTVDSVTTYIGSITTLNGGQSHSLTKEWDDAVKLAKKGQFNGAIGNIETFISELNDLYGSGFLTEDQYNALIQAANYQISLYQQGEI